MKNSVQNIIVRMPNWVGDLVMATAVLSDLRDHFPQASITAMCKRPLCELLEKDERIDELFCFTRGKNSFGRREDLKDIIAKIRAGNYDVGILLTNSFSSAWWFWQGNVQRRIGYKRGARGLFLTDAIEFHEEKEHQVLSYKRLLAPLGIPLSENPPKLFFSKGEIEEAKTLLHQRGFQEGACLIGINPGAAYGSSKCWPKEHFRALAMRLLLEKPDAFIVFFGDYKTADLVKEISRALPERVMNLAGVTSLRELACLIKVCSVFVTNDSGPMHIAAALDVPLIALFGSTDEELTGPYGKEESVVNKKAACSPCFKRVCPIDFRCMKEIGVEEVLKRVLHHV